MPMKKKVTRSKAKKTVTAKKTTSRAKANHKPRTASGKKADPSTRADAELKSLAGLKERTEEGHLKAGRTPPSQKGKGRRAGAARVVEEYIRDYIPVTEDEKLLQSGW